MQRECDFSAGLQIANDTAKLAPAASFCNRTAPSIRSYCFEGMGVTAGVLYPGAETFQGCLAASRSYTVSCMTGAQRGALPPGVANAPVSSSVFSRS